MKISIFTFSGTGNTYVTADFIADTLKSHNAHAEQFKIEEAMREKRPLDFKGIDHILIGYPIYAFNAPEMVVDFIKRFPECSGQKISIFKTAGEPFFLNKCSSDLMKRILFKKGYDVQTETLFLMPYNIMFRYEDALVKQMYFLMQKMAGEFAGEVVAGTRQSIHCPLLSKIVSFIFRIQWPGARLNGRLYSCNRKKCTMCMKCVRECPTQNITAKGGKIRFDGKCAMCMRCVQRCPAKAINIGILRFWAVRGEYDFEKLVKDQSVSSDFVNPNTRGYFRLFRKYFGVK